MVIILDGSYGMELKIRKSRGEPVAHNQELFSTAALLDTPEQITRLHRDYIRAGAQVLTTASYACTRFYLRKVGEAHRVPELARLSVELAREAVRQEGAEDTVRVAASVPPLGESYNASNKLTKEEEWEQYIELCNGLKGADIFLCETMSGIEEAKTAIDACREAAPGKEIWLSFCLLSNDTLGVTLIDGTPIAEAAARVMSWGISTMMFNCATPELIGSAIRQAVAAKLPGLVTGGYGNCWEDITTCVADGEWTITMNESTHHSGDQACGGFHVRDDLPDDLYAKAFVGYLDAGATIVGGCCGIGPGAIAAIRDILEERRLAAAEEEREASLEPVGSPCEFGHTTGNCVICKRYNETAEAEGLTPAFPSRSESGVEEVDSHYPRPSCLPVYDFCDPKNFTRRWDDESDGELTMPAFTPRNSMLMDDETDMGLGMLGLAKSRSDAYGNGEVELLAMPSFTKCRSDPGPLWTSSQFAPARSVLLRSIRGLTPRNV